jgi:pro-apoptotic serine protease NMA111
MSRFKQILNVITAKLTVTWLALVLTIQPQTIYGQEDQWQHAIDKVTQSIVSIQMEVPRYFETSKQMTSQGTGFIVDAKRGIILTNRHIVQPGPVTATAIFVNQEEVELQAIYRDPVHDFGFFKYDPSKLRHIDVKSLVLRPDLAKVGAQIRVIGNDSGEKLSILDGTLARLNRQAPNYGPSGYNDFNTFYIQAASGAKGGSSGSPVINEDGQVVALQAGGAFLANTNMFLPLDRVVRALKLIQQDKAITRGTLQTTFVHKSYAELRRLGLKDEQEVAFRAKQPKAEGALVVDSVLPKGPAAEVLKPGDILYRINGDIIAHFVPLEALLDEQIGQSISLDYIRGDQLLSGKVTVADLADITPKRYVEIGRGVLHNLSYQQARHLNRPVEGVVVAVAGYMLGSGGVPSGAVVTSINKMPIENLDDAIEALNKIPDGAEFPVRYFSVRDPHNDSLAIVEHDRDWFAANDCRLQQSSGLWQCTALAAVPESSTVEVQNGQHPIQQGELANKIAPSLVWVSFNTPYVVDENPRSRSSGSGLIIDAEQGLVAVDRTTVPAVMGEVQLTFAGSVEIPAQVVFLHPLHNLALLKYDPALIGSTKVESAKLSPVRPEYGDIIHAAGTNYNYQVLVQTRKIASYGPLRVNSSSKAFQDANLMVISTDSSYNHNSGVFINDLGEVVAMILSYPSNGRGASSFWAVPAQHLIDLISLYDSGAKYMRSLEVEWRLISFVTARRLGLPEEWLNKITEKDPKSHQLLTVNNTWKGSDAEQKLLSGDLLLAVDGKTLTSFREVEMASQKPQVTLTIARDGEVQELTVKTEQLSGTGTEHMVIWAGAHIQMPHRALKTRFGLAKAGVYVVRQNFGSPAQHYGIRGMLITAVDGQPTANLEQFIAAVKDKGDRESVRLDVTDIRGNSRVITLTLNNNYWPLAEVKKHQGKWKRIAR